MSHEAIEVGAFTWSRIKRLYDADPVIHWQRCESEGLQCPQEVFSQPFHEEANSEEFAAIVRAVDWGRVRWELEELSSVALRHVRVDRGYQHALDEARDRATQCMRIIYSRVGALEPSRVRLSATLQKGTTGRQVDIKTVNRKRIREVTVAMKP
jgi:hypothetical protein